MNNPSPDIFGHTFQVRVQERLFRDPVHGLISVNEQSDQGRLITALIDCAEMQRLRRIRQLGLASLAFPGAEHSRFTHCIGVYHTLGRILDHLNRMYTIDSELAFFASVAALLHDLGHGPFSHVSERFLGRSHEDRTVDILHDSDTEVHRALSGYSRKLPSIIESLLRGTAKPGYLSSLVSSELDADRLDYLLRDGLMTGVKYGVHDTERLIHMMRISPDGEHLIVASGGLVPVEKYIQARYHMHRQVYMHKTVIAAEAMLTAIIARLRSLAREERGPGADGTPLVRILRDPDCATNADFLDLDDYFVMTAMRGWSRCGDPVLADMSARLLGRRLFKTLELRADDLDADRMARVREIIAQAGLDPAYYLLTVESENTPYHPYGSKPGARAILIGEEDGPLTDVAKLSPTIEVFTRSAWRCTRLVFPERHEGHEIRKDIEALFRDVRAEPASSR